MSTPRNPPGGPAEATADIAQRAWEGTIVSAVLVPVFQLIFLELAQAMHSVDSTALSMEPMSIFYTGIIVLGFIPIVSTVVSTAVAYGAAGWPGVGLYYVISIGASMMLGAELTGAIIFMTGLVLFLFAAAFTARSNRGRKRPRQPI